MTAALYFEVIVHGEKFMITQIFMMTDIYLRNRAVMLKIAWDYTRVPSEVDDIVSDTCDMLIQHLDCLDQRSFAAGGLWRQAV